MIRFKYIIKARRNDYEQKSNKRDTGNRFYGVLPYHGTAPESTGSTRDTNLFCGRSPADGTVMAGGVAASVVNVRNCYNTGKISASASARGYIGGIAGEQSSAAKGKSSDAAACNYNTATVKAGSEMSRSYPQNTGYTLQNIREWS